VRPADTGESYAPGRRRELRFCRGCRSAGCRARRRVDHGAESGINDEKVIELAASQRRLLLTEDKDFGQLVFAAAKENSGVILIRYRAPARSTLIEAVVKLLSDRGEALYSRFVVLEPGRVRITQLVAS
jgi:predicted nuclease of predicted toxin-antitoxin system